MSYIEELEQLYEFIELHTGENEEKRWKKLIKDVIIPEIEKNYGRRLLKMSHQRRWQLLHSAAGLCQNCNNPATQGVYCEHHHKKQEEYRAWRQGKEAGSVEENDTSNQATT